MSPFFVEQLVREMYETEKASLGATLLAMSPALQRLQKLTQVRVTWIQLFLYNMSLSFAPDATPSLAEHVTQRNASNHFL
jgi:hypothetical protein